MGEDSSLKSKKVFDETYDLKNNMWENSSGKIDLDNLRKSHMSLYTVVRSL
jgi:hypothetical protein